MTTLADRDFVTGGLETWDPLIKQWFGVLADYIGAIHHDAAHWYNERATLSTLAGAVWRTEGSLALEDYRCSRRFGRQTFNGRADLWFTLADGQYVVEAKQGWPRRAGACGTRVGSLLEAARDQVTSINLDGAIPVSLAFMAPRIANQPDDAHLRGWIDACRRADRVDLVAWHFDARFRSRPSPANGAFYPGVILVARREGNER